MNSPASFAEVPRWRLALPDTLSADRFIASLSDKFSLTELSHSTAQRVFYDSADWRLYRARLLCTWDERDQESTLSLWRRDDETLLHAAVLQQPPRYAAECTDDTLRSHLQRVLSVRALLAVTTLDYRAIDGCILDTAGATLARFRLEEYYTAPARFALFPHPHHGKACDKLVYWLEKKLHLHAAREDLLRAVLAAHGRTPNDYHPKPELPWTSHMPVGEACALLWRHLLATLRFNETGIQQRIDSEFLHDFRIAVRRARSLLGQAKDVLPADTRKHHAAWFARLGQMTNPARDYDVYLAQLPNLTTALAPTLHEGLPALYQLLTTQRDAAYERLCAYLAQTDYREGWHAWEQELTRALDPTRGEWSTQPLKPWADAKIWRLYRGILRDGAAIDEHSAPEALHALRKRCKKLRYMMEFFQSLYRERDLKPALKSLKKFQNILGEIQDCTIQQQMLYQLSTAHGHLPTVTVLAMGALMQHLTQRCEQARADFQRCFAMFSHPTEQARFARLFANI